MSRKEHIEAVTLLVGHFGRKMAHQGCENKKMHKVTMGQTTLLLQIGRSKNKNGLTISEIAERIGVSRSAITQIADTMFEHGLIERIENPDDKRSVRIVLTEKSRKYLKGYRKKMIDAASRMLDCLDDSELEDLHSMLLRIDERSNNS